jgi:hypothetical protein
MPHPHHPRHGVLTPLALRHQQRLILAKVGSDQPPDRGPPDLAGPPLPVRVELGQASALTTLTQPIHRPHPDERRANRLVKWDLAGR